VHVGSVLEVILRELEEVEKQAKADSKEQKAANETMTLKLAEVELKVTMLNPKKYIEIDY
jgi:hypothetical protein